MTKLTTLTGAPADFPLEVEVRDLSGVPFDITFICHGRTLRDWHPVAIRRAADDANHALASAEIVKSKEVSGNDRLIVDEADVQSSLDKGLERMVSIILEVAQGWDLEDDFNAAGIAQLCSKFPGVHQALWAKYDQRVRGDRLGN